MPESTYRGALTEAVFYILLALFEPTHGYGIIKFVRSITDNRVILGSGTLYGAINTMLKNNWIEIPETQDSDKKQYVITKIGRIMVENEIVRLKELAAHGDSIINGSL